MNLALEKSGAEQVRQAASDSPWLANFWRRPRKTRVRKLLFQIHLWTGIGIGLIATVVGVSGSAIVYKDSLDRIFTPQLFRTSPGGRELGADALLSAAHAAYPGRAVTFAMVQEKPGSASAEPWIFYINPPAGNAMAHVTLAYFDPVSGRRLGAIGEASGVMNWLAALHIRLLGGSNGTLVNGIGACLLFLLCATGIVIWWPGRGHVRRGLRIEWKARWLRLNWDTHSAVGFWSSICLAIEAFTGAYYCFFVPMGAALVFLLGGSVHQWQEMSVPPRSTVVSGAPSAPLQPLIDRARRLHPDCTLRGLALPALPTDPLIVEMDPPHAVDLGQYAQVAFDRYSGRILSDVDSRSQPMAIRIMLFIRPLHFGTFAGNWSRIAWIVVGLVPGLLFFTGFVLWWRRVPGKLLRSRKPTVV